MENIEHKFANSFCEENLVDEIDDSYYKLKIDIDVSEGADLIISDFDNYEDDCLLEPIRKLYITVIRCGETMDDKTVANLELYLIPDGLSKEETNIFLDSADAESGDMVYELSALVKHKFYKRNAFFDYDGCDYPNTETVFNGSIHTLFVNPKYRKKHIGSFLLNNLNAILYRYLRYNVRCLTTYVNPFHNDVWGDYILTSRKELSKQDMVMIKDTINFLKSLGFVKVRNFKNTYIIDLFEKNSNQ